MKNQKNKQICFAIFFFICSLFSTPLCEATEICELRLGTQSIGSQQGNDPYQIENLVNNLTQQPASATPTEIVRIIGKHVESFNDQSLYQYLDNKIQHYLTSKKYLPGFSPGKTPTHLDQLLDDLIDLNAPERMASLWLNIFGNSAGMDINFFLLEDNGFHTQKTSIRNLIDYGIHYWVYIQIQKRIHEGRWSYFPNQEFKEKYQLFLNDPRKNRRIEEFNSNFRSPPL